jgi:hypothetical protein
MRKEPFSRRFIRIIALNDVSMCGDASRMQRYSRMAAMTGCVQHVDPQRIGLKMRPTPANAWAHCLQRSTSTLITLDEDLWSETKDPIRALAVAELLGIEVEQSMAWRKLPFAWHGFLGEHTFNTLEYTKMMLDAYAGQDTNRGSK